MFQIKPNCSILGAFLGVSLFLLTPCVSWFSIIGAEYVLDCLFSFFLLWLVLKWSWDRSCVVIFFQLAFFSVLSVWVLHFYGSSLAVVSTCWLKLLVDVFKKTRGHSRKTHLLFFAGTLLSTVLGTFWPYLWYTSRPLLFFRSGGTFTIEPGELVANFYTLGQDLFVKSISYLLENDIPSAAFPWDRGGLIILGLALLGVVTNRKTEGIRWLLVLGVSSIVVTVVAANMPGIRRAIPLVAVVCVFAGLGYDFVLSSLPVGRKALYRGAILICAVLISAFDIVVSFPIEAVFGAVSCLLLLSLTYILGVPNIQRFGNKLVTASFILIPLTSFLQSYQNISQSYLPWLQRTFAYAPGKGYEETIEDMVHRLSQGELIIDTNEYSSDTAVLVSLLCNRRHDHCSKPIVLGPKYDKNLVGKVFVLPEGH